METQEGNVFFAIAHPERRRILEALLLEEKPAMDLPGAGTPSALSQHLRVLKKAHLVAERREGRRRIYRLTPEPLQEPYAWLNQYEAFWEGKFSRLRGFLERTYGPRPSQTAPHGGKDQDD